MLTFEKTSELGTEMFYPRRLLLSLVIAAGAVLLEGTRVESWSVFAGVPAKKVKQLSPELFKEEVMRIADNYVFYASWFK